ncbi:hypothetical protein L1887_53434 [Cichorium endivia]|nr:hypothetical protein L1887_53434 [Cichorium endivia]
MIGRADIEGSKSNVAMNAWLPQASYPCVGFPLSVPVLSWLFDARGRPPEGAVPSPSPGRHAATRSPPRKQLEQSRRQPTGSGLGPPVPSPQSQSFSRGYGSILPTSLAYIVPSTRGCSPWRPDAVMSTTGRGRHSVPPDFQGPPGAHPDTARQKITLPEAPADVSGLPNVADRLTHVQVPFTWNLSPLRPSKFSFEYLLLTTKIRTNGRSAQAHAQGFAATAAPSYSSGPGTCPDGRGVGRALKRHPFSGLVDSAVLLTKNGPLGALDSVARLNEAAAPSYLFKNSHPGSSYPEGNFGGNQLLDGSISLSPLYPSQTNDLHVSIAAGPPPEFPLASPRSGIVHHLSGPTGMLTLEPFSEDQGRSAVHPARGIPPISFLAPCGFTHPLTRTHVRLLGPCFKTGRMGCPQAGAGSTQVYRRDGACCQPRSTRRHLHEPIDSSGFGRRTNPHRSTPRVDRRTGYRRSTSDRDASPAPIRFPPRQFQALFDSLFKVLFIFPSRYLFAIGLTPVFSLGPEFTALLGLHSQTTDSQTAPRGATGSGHDGALTLSGAPFQGLGPGPPLRTLLQTTIRTARPSDFQAGLIPVHVHGSFCFAGFDNDPSAGSPTETLLRLLLPLNDKVQWNSRDVAGGEPPTSPRS